MKSQSSVLFIAILFLSEFNGPSCYSFHMVSNSFEWNFHKSFASLQWTALKQALPSNVQLLTAENWDGGYKLLRFEHFYEAKDHSLLRDPVTFDIVSAITGNLLQFVHKFLTYSSQCSLPISQLIYREFMSVFVTK